jgi:hypothetical protein
MAKTTTGLPNFAPNYKDTYAKPPKIPMQFRKLKKLFFKEAKPYGQ